MAFIPFFALADEYIVIDGVTYIKHSLYMVNDPIKQTLGVKNHYHYYEIMESTIEMPAGEGAAIEIQGNVVLAVSGTLKVKGGDAKGYIGAGAGIHVPKGASLRIMPGLNNGECTVIATGGNAGQPNVIVNNGKWERYNNGAGGAGAGIGGNGGNGGTAISFMEPTGNMSNGHYGLASDACGNITIDRGVNLTAIGGCGTGVAHDENGATVYNFNIVAQENAPITYGYVPAGMNYEAAYVDMELYTDLAHTSGSSWGFSNSAWGSPGGQGGGGGGYPAAGIGGGGSGGGAGGFGSYPSWQTKEATAAGDGGNAGGGGTGYGFNGQFGTSGGYAKFGWGMDHEIICQVGPTEKGPGAYTKVDNQYTGRNGYWGQKNFSGFGHAKGQTGSTMQSGVRPGTFLDGGNGGEPVSGSDVKNAGLPGGGVMFDSECGQIIIRGKVISKANGGHQPQQYTKIGSVTYTEPYQPYYINEIGTALPGLENPYTVIVEGGSLEMNRQDYVKIDQRDYVPTNPADVLEIPIKNYSDNGTYTVGTHKLSWLPDDEVRHYRQYLPHSTLYVSQVKDGSFGYMGYYQSDFNDNDPIHQPVFDLTVDASRGWGYRTDGTWGSIRSGQQFFTGRINDEMIDKNRVNILRFDACMDWNANNNNHMWVDDFEIYPTVTDELWQERIAPITGNTFRGRCTGDDVAIKNLRWEPFEVEFSGNGGRNYVLETMTANALPVYTNNNTDGTEILGFYTQPVTFENGRLKVNGDTYNSIAEFVRKGCTKIYAVTWNPTTDIIPIFSGDGGRDYVLMSLDNNKLPEYKNNNTDGSEIFGFYTEPATIVDDMVQVHGQSFNSIKEFVDNGYSVIYAVTWIPSKTIIRKASREKIDLTNNGAVATIGDNSLLMSKMDIGKGFTVKVKTQKQSVLSFKFKGYMSVQIDNGEPIPYESSAPDYQSSPIGTKWKNKRIIIPAGEHNVKLICLDGKNSVYDFPWATYIYGVAVHQMPTEDENGVFHITSSEELTALSRLVNYEGTGTYKTKNYKVKGTIETSEDFETIGPDMAYLFSGTMSGGHIILTNNQPLIYFARGATFSDITVSGVLENHQGMLTLMPTRTTFINCKIEGTISSINNRVSAFGYGNGSSFYNCVNDVYITSTSTSSSYDNTASGYGSATTIQDCVFTGTVNMTNKDGVTVAGEPFASNSTAIIQNCISTFDPGTETLLGQTVENVYVLSTTEEERGNYFTKTAAQFADGEVANLLANCGISHWYTPAGSPIPVYDPENEYSHSRIVAGENLVITKSSPAAVRSKVNRAASTDAASRIHLYEGDEFTVRHVANQPCQILLNGEVVSTNGTYTSKAPAGESVFAIKEAVPGDEFTYNGVAYVILTLPEGDENGTVMTKPGEYNAYGNPNLSGSLIIPSNVEYLNTEYTVTEIGEYSLGGGGVTSVELPKTLTVIGGSGLRGLTSVESIVIPASVETLGYELFKNCSNLKSVTFAEGSKITSLPQSAFEETGISTLVIPETVTSIGSFAFFRCPNLESIELPEGLTSLGWMAFGDDSNLKTIVYLSDEPVSGSSNDFADYATPTLYALKSAQEEYESVDPWKMFTNTVWVGVHLDKSEMSMRTNESDQLTADVVVPPGKTASDVVWSSSDPAVATVDENGKVYAVSAGTATITATSGDYKADSQVTVTDFTTGINEIFADESETADIYTLQGVCIKRDATLEDVKALTPGFYIIGGHKIYISR
jgi:hypothetical protein